ncbi:MAG: polysaccharide deacetylase family protein [Flavobacteriales bacterium]
MKKWIVQTYKSLVGRIERLVGELTPQNDLVVLCMHSIPVEFETTFQNLISKLRRKYVVLSPDELEDFLKNPSNYQNGPYLIFTFDDGLKNNLRAAKILEKNSISGLFFIVPDFVNSSNPSEFYRTNIRPEKERIEKSNSDVTPMTWEELEELVSMGHVVGCHTHSHLLHPDMNETDSRKEIVESKKLLEDKLSIQITHFASPNNTLESVNENSAQLIRDNYKYHHTTVPGLFRKHLVDDHLVFRRNIEVHWKTGPTLFALGSFDLRRWREARNVLSRF